MDNIILSVKNFSKSFRSHWTYRQILAVSNLSLDIYKGESFGFIGHNGAGKTTTIKSILGLLHSNKGEFIFEGKKLKTAKQRSKIGYLPEQPYFYDHLNVEETLEFFSALYGLKGKAKKKRIAELLERLNLSHKAKQKIGTLSKGLQQRLGIASSIINNPKLLFLDEPFSGLDPVGRREIRELIVELNKNGTTIFLSSHILSDVQDMCDRVGILANGRLKAQFALKDLPKLYGQGYELKILDSQKNRQAIEELSQKATSVSQHETIKNSYSTLYFATYEEVKESISKAINLGLPIEQFQTTTVKLEDVFVSIVKDENSKSLTSEEVAS